MPIAFAPLNESLTIVKILLEDSVKKRLNSLGLLVNANIEILSKTSGNLIVLIKDTRIAIDKNIATKIFVARREDQNV